mgnify:CR=1 FL=1
MTGPWDKYKPPVIGVGPWDKYSQGQTALDKFQALPEAERRKIIAEYSRAMNANNIGTMGKAAATFLQGIPFVGEYADEALAKAAPYVGPNSEEIALQSIRAGQEGFAASNPKTSLGLKIGGGLAGSAATLAALPSMIIPATLGGRALAGAGVGGALGGAEGFTSGYGAGTDADSRWHQAKRRGAGGLAVGTILGAGLPFVQEGLSRGGRWLLDQMTIAKNAKQQGLSKPSYELLTRAMENDQSLTGTGAQRLTNAGPDAMLADAGPSARSLLDTTIQKSGPAGSIASQAVERRAEAANRVVTDALDNTFGVPKGLLSTEAGIRQGTAGARSAAYDAAYSSPINYAAPEAMDLQQLLTRVPSEALASANKLMKMEGVKSPQIMATISPNGAVKYSRLPDVRQIDYITRGLNQAAETGEGAGALGGQTAMGRAYQNLSRDIRSTLKGLVPEYGKALNTAAEPIAARNALRFGESIFSSGTTRDEVARELQGMSGAERLSAMTGARAFIDEKIANVTRAVTDGNMEAREAAAAIKSLSSRANHEKISSLVGQAGADRLFQAIDRAAMSLDLRAGVAQNSKTFARLAMDKTVQDYTNSGVWNAVKSGEPVNAGKHIIQNILGGTPQAKQAAEDKIYQEVTTALTGPRGPDAQRMLQLLQTIGVKNPQNAEIARKLANLLSGFGIGIPAYQAGTRGLPQAQQNRGLQ